MDIIEKYNINEDEINLLSKYFKSIFTKEKNIKYKEYRTNYYKKKRLNDNENKLKSKKNYNKFIIIYD